MEALPLPFVIPSEAEGSAVQQTFPGNVFDCPPGVKPNSLSSIGGQSLYVKKPYLDESSARQLTLRRRLTVSRLE
jgi:hypothetical protein